MRAFARKRAIRSGASDVSTTHWPAQHYRAQESPLKGPMPMARQPSSASCRAAEKPP
jgi:hypothetical protein